MAAMGNYAANEQHARRSGVAVGSNPCPLSFPPLLPSQGRESSYTLTETRIGGSLSRHDLSIEQLGEATQSQVGLAARVCMAPAALLRL